MVLYVLFGCEKNERANVSDKELQALQVAATDDLLKLTAEQLNRAVSQEILQEIFNAS